MIGMCAFLGSVTDSAQTKPRWRMPVISVRGRSESEGVQDWPGLQKGLVLKYKTKPFQRK